MKHQLKPNARNASFAEAERTVGPRRWADLPRALAGLIVPDRVAERLAHTDFARELRRNKQLGQAPRETRDEQFRLLVSTTAARGRRLRAVLLKSFLLMASAVGAGVLANSALPPSLAQATVPLTLLSVFAFALATLGRLGWAGQSIKGDTAFERLDAFIFRALYWLGMLLGTLALL